jgi:spermidine synthase
MSVALLTDFSIDTHDKLYEKETPDGLIAVFQTAHLGKILTLNGQIYLSEQDGFFYHEMMTHPALFTHPMPKKIAIIGNSSGILREVLKHEKIQEIDCIDNQPHLTKAINRFFAPQPEKEARTKCRTIETSKWLSECSHHAAYDVIIYTQPYEKYFQPLCRLLTSDGILVQPHTISLLQPNILTSLYEKIQQSGFLSWQILNFPQPSYPSGWRVLSMATKHSVFKRVREIEVFNRPFTTRYYNYDMHKAALALPEFANYLFNSDTL